MIQKLKDKLNHNNGLIGSFYNFLKLKKYEFRNYKKHNLNSKNQDNTLNKYTKELREKGFCIIKDFISINDCQTYKKIINDFIINSNKLVWKDSNDSDNRIYGAENISEKFKNLPLNEFTKNIGSAFLNQRLKLFMIMANKLIFKDNNLGSGGGWHKDSNAKQFKSILYLSDVYEENGPLQIIKNSNSNIFNLNMFLKLKKKFPVYRYSNDDVIKLIKQKDLIEFKEKAGTLILFNTSLLHRGMPIKKGTRYALTNYFYPEERIDENENKFEKRIKKKLY